MFDNEIDVAAIMQKIKQSVVGNDVDECIESNEVERITEFINNTRRENEPYMEIGLRLPQALRFPSVIRKIIVLFSRAVRKSTRFMAKDQIIVNHNVDACIKALVEREDAIKNDFEQRLQDLECQNVQLLQEYEYIKGKYEDSILPEEVYVEFEDRFRGSKDEISARLDYYVTRFIPETSEEKELCLDVGCGRGEWLKKMELAGYKAIGVDINEEMVQVCKNQQLEAYCDEAIHFLRNYKDNSVAVVSAFQVIEHIGKREVLELLQEVFRVLKPNGKVILETPNICNIEVGATAFQLDPTHMNPMHPELLKFFAEYVGYKKCEIVYWKEEEVEHWISSVVEQEETHRIDSTVVRVMLETMKRLVYCSPDYALVAVKTGED